MKRADQPLHWGNKANSFRKVFRQEIEDDEGSCLAISEMQLYSMQVSKHAWGVIHTITFTWKMFYIGSNNTNTFLPEKAFDLNKDLHKTPKLW